jgi:adenylyl- and sulfurtransferase ThiI
MKVTLDDIRKKFDALESGQESREEISDFAFRAMKADDVRTLEMEPACQDKIWKAILYLLGVDLKNTDNPDGYLRRASSNCREDLFDF